MKAAWGKVLDFIFGPEEEGEVWDIDLRPRTRLDDWQDGYWRLRRSLRREPTTRELLEEVIDE